jgi:cytochrome b
MNKVTKAKTLVWDLPTRAFHWLLAIAFVGAFVTAESERLRDLHMLMGYSAAGLVAFRLLWGILGTRYARFTSLPLSPRAVVTYLKSLLTLSPRHYFGHNPAGSWAVVGMLVLITLTVATGWAQAVEVGPRWVEDLHEGLANTTIAVIGVHIVAVLLSSLLHRENLVRAMLSGYKLGSGTPAAGSRWFGALLLVGALGAFWAGVIPAPGIEPGKSIVQAAAKPAAPGEGHRTQRREHDDD